MPTLIVERQSGFGLSVADIDIIVDGKERGSLGRAPKIELRLHPGPHAIQVRMGSTVSQPVYFKADERETVGFACLTTGVWQRRLTLQRVFHRQPDDRFGRRKAVADLSDQHISGSFRGDVADWHLVLNVPDNAGPEQIRRAYLDLIRQYHPDNLVRLTPHERHAAEHAARIVNNAYTAAKRKHRLP
jgi:hypothetical protein